MPVSEYGHCSITGGHVNRGPAYATLRGRHIFGDFCSGRIRTIPNTGTKLPPEIAVSTGLRITSFGEDEAGEVYFVTSTGGPCRVQGWRHRRPTDPPAPVNPLTGRRRLVLMGE